MITGQSHPRRFMSNDLRWFAPQPQPVPEAIIVHELTREFYREVEHREEFDRYCQWYRLAAEQHQRELQKMRGDINLFGWFCRKRRSVAP